LFAVLAKETPVITWPTPSAIVYGTALGSAQLNAQANVPGTFGYAPPSGTVLPAGQAQQLSVTFTPDNTIRYFNATTTVFINVAKASQQTLVVTGPSSAVFGTSFLVGTTGGSGTGNVTFAVTGVCTVAAATVTMTSGTGVCTVTATKAGDSNYLEATSAPLTVTAESATQAVLVVTGAPATAANGSSFSVGTIGGSGTGAVTFNTIGACTNVGPNVSMTSSTGTCSITATKAGDANYLATTSAPAVVLASGPVPPAFDIVPTNGFLSVPATGSPTPSSLSVRLQVNGVSIVAPSGGVAVTASSSNPQCVAVTNGTVAAGAFAGSIGIGYAGAALPCTSTVTATTSEFGSDAATVSVYSYADAPVTGTATALSYFNPAPIPSPTGSVVSSRSSVSYYNPAPLPSPSGVVSSSRSSVSYFNPAPIPNPSGVTATSVSAVSYYNPAPLPGNNGLVNANVAAVSYANGTPGSSGQTAAQESLAALASDPFNDTIAVNAISIANGPTATQVTPIRLSRAAGAAYTLTITGANLTSASNVRLVGIELDVVVAAPTVSNDGRRLTVNVIVLPNAPLGMTNVVVSGTGWSTPELPGMRVEIVP
jgi:hypothetical protein